MREILIAIVVWVVAAIVCYLVGGLLATVDPVTEIGNFLRGNAGLIGFLVGVVYYFFGGNRFQLR